MIAGPNDPGSPYAIGSAAGGHKDIHPELGTLSDFRHFVKTANAMGMDVALDFALQCSQDHSYIKQHPDWFEFRPDGTIRYAENPPKKYQDVVNFNFSSKDRDNLWHELRSIFLYWIEQGVTIFRVDNPHTKPFAFWEWAISTIHEKHPEIIFLSEAFTKPKVMYRLAKLGFTQSYTYFTWRNEKSDLTGYLTELSQETNDIFRPNFFVNTPDIFPKFLQTSGRAGYMTRVALAATLGASYGVYSGYELCEGGAVPGKEEYLDSEKYEYKPRDWNAPGNIKHLITQLNQIRNENPALHQLKNLRFIPSSNDNVIVYAKYVPGNVVFVAVNMDPHNVQETHIDMPYDLLDLPGTAGQTYRLEDLLLGHIWQWSGAWQHLRLDPRN